MKKISGAVKAFAAVGAACFLIELAAGPMAPVTIYKLGSQKYFDYKFAWWDFKRWVWLDVIKDPKAISEERQRQRDLKWNDEVWAAGFVRSYDEFGNWQGFEVTDFHPIPRY